jgi:hypothetical protein
LTLKNDFGSILPFEKEYFRIINAQTLCEVIRTTALKQCILILFLCLALLFTACTNSNRLEVDTLVVSPSTLLSGSTNKVTATVTNTTDSEITYEIILSSTGTSLDSRLVTLQENSTEEVSFPIEELLPGSYSISIGNATSMFTIINLEALLRESEDAMRLIKSYHVTIDIEMESTQ